MDQFLYQKECAPGIHTERKGQLVSIILVHGHPSHANARIHLKGDNGDVKKKGNASFRHFSGILNVHNHNCWRIIS